MTRDEKIAKLKEMGYSFGDSSSSPPSPSSGSPMGRAPEPIIQQGAPQPLTREEKLKKLEERGYKITAPEVNPKWYESAGAFAASTLKTAFMEVAKIGAIIPRLTGLDDGTALREADQAGDALVKQVSPNSDTAIAAGKVAGSILPYLIPVGSAAKAGSTIGQVFTQGAKAGLGIGAVSGMASEAGNPESGALDILKGGAIGAALGAAVGGTVPAGVAGIGQLFKGTKTALSSTNLPQNKAVQSLLDDIAPKDSQILTKAKSVSQQALHTHNKLVSQYYDDAYKTTVPTDVVKSFENNPTIKRALDQLAKREDAVGDAYRALPRDSFARFDIVKKHLNADYSRFADKTKPDKFAASLTSDVIHEITNKLDELAPSYQKARLLAGDDITGINKLKSTPLGKLANTKDGAFVDLSKKVFNSRLDPEDFKYMRDAYVKQDPEIWNGLTRRYIEDSMESLKNVGGDKNTPYRLYQAVLGNDKKIGMLSEALNVPGPKNELNKLKLLVTSRVFDEAFAPSSKLEQVSQSIPIGAGEFIRSLKPTQQEAFNKKIISFLTTSKYDAEFAKIARNKTLSDADKVNAIMKLWAPSYSVRLRGLTPAVSAGTGKAPSALTGSSGAGRETSESDGL